ncbi:hypothetical protein KSD_31330 [Ktedonobacter sp. SOSP1-85]|uniref:hypothetical protein n=1 Tax=Ktedonobacter sp. SOSP1-85 TaxID=2778367 RepID=UPI00191699BA|nr:hypothetical protein [Ktedonobacter sp. SOSP1-85]GHO75362.1 hypothetical protein KSD_31330 [Ktedonobacter sp. SOSP1-85]
MRKRLIIGSLGVLAALLMALIPLSSASAHEMRHVGNYTFIVGFLNEPAYTGSQNAISLTVCNGKTCEIAGGGDDGPVSNPVNDVDKSLKAEVSTGGSAPLALSLQPVDGAPGKYTADFIPTQTGDYTFHFTGTLNGQKIDEKFTSGPNTFSEVAQISSYPASKGTTTQGRNDISSLQAQIQDAKNTGILVGSIGTLVGLIGLGTAVVALRRRPASGTQSDESLRG